ncbi:hypothetical protein HDU97_001307, partial [Phlyctochytrium planicorne]
MIPNATTTPTVPAANSNSKNTESRQQRRFRLRCFVKMFRKTPALSTRTDSGISLVERLGLAKAKVEQSRAVQALRQAVMACTGWIGKAKKDSSRKVPESTEEIPSDEKMTLLSDGIVEAFKILLSCECLEGSVDVNLDRLISAVPLLRNPVNEKTMREIQEIGLEAYVAESPIPIAGELIGSYLKKLVQSIEGGLLVKPICEMISDLVDTTE